MVEFQISDASLERVLRSKTFAASPSSRRLLKYLAERTSSGDPDLKEYSVGIDVFGKSASYDPQRDSTVRIQVGRLRQKLIEYYEDEGKAETLILAIPKGSFRLSVTTRSALLEPGLVEPLPAEPMPLAPNPEQAVVRWRWAAIAASIAFLALLAFNLGQNWRSPQNFSDAWNEDLEELWRPLLGSPRPLLIAFSAPLFVELQGTMLFRARGEEIWEQAVTSKKLESVREALGNPQVKPTYYYAAAGEVGAAFSLARALSPRKQNISISRDVQLTWQQLADNNVLFLGAPRFFRDKLRDLPMNLEILADADSFRVAHPVAGEPASYPKNGVQGDGETYALFTHIPGPGGKGSIMSFMSNDTFGRQGAVQAFTDADFAKKLTGKLRGPDRKIPQFYQVLLKVKLKGGVTTDISPVLYRALTTRSNAAQESL